MYERGGGTAAIEEGGGHGWPGRLEEKVLKALLILRHQLSRTIPIPKGARSLERGGEMEDLSLPLPLIVGGCSLAIAQVM